MRMTLYEIDRLLHVRKTWLFMAVFTMAPILMCTNLFGYGTLYSGSMTNVFMLQPAKIAAFAGVFAALFLTLLEMQRMTKFRMNALMETIVDLPRYQLRQTAAIIAVATISFIAALTVLLPYTEAAMGAAFKTVPFWASWAGIYFGGILTTILLASGLFMITNSFDASFIIVGILTAISHFLATGSNYLLFWVQTNVNLFSDATESYLQVDVILYTRLIWLLAACAVYTLGLAGIRRYGQDLWQSVSYSYKKTRLPVLPALLLTGCMVAAYNEPLFDNGPIVRSKRSVDPETGIVIYKVDDSYILDDTTNKSVAFQNGSADITIDTRKRQLIGEAAYTLFNSSGREQKVPFCISPGLDLIEVYENDVKIKFSKNRLDNYMCSIYYLKLTADKEATLRISYKGSPESDRDDQKRQWGITDKFVLVPYTFPLPNNDLFFRMKCKLNLPEKLTPIVKNTVIREVSSEKAGYKTYEYQSGDAAWLIAGEYVLEKLDAGGQEIRFMYLKGREQYIKDSGSAAVIADIVNFFTEKFGPLDFKGLPFVIAELDSSFVTGGWGLGNMSVYDETNFVGAVYKSHGEKDNIEGGSGIGVAVHEIAHQWWGWSPDGVIVTEDGQSPWSAEGLTVYSTYLYLKERYGEEYAKKEMADVWESNTKKMQNAFYLNHLEYAAKLSDNDAADIYSDFASITRYDMMPYLLLKAEKLTGGEDAFLKALKKISLKYRRRELTYRTFLSELGITKEDLQIE